MDVEELIKELKKYPKDACVELVYYNDSDYSGCDKESYLNKIIYYEKTNEVYLFTSDQSYTLNEMVKQKFYNE